MRTAIAWTDETWNPVVGCTQISPGCAHCYAKSLHDMRHKAFQNGKLQNVQQYAEPFEKVQELYERLYTPFSWRKPRRVFVNSMADLFHEDLTDDYIASVFATMLLARDHQFQVLTKRPFRMRALLTSAEFRENVENDSGAQWAVEDAESMRGRFDPNERTRDDIRAYDPGWPLPNVWLGVSVENQRWANERIPILLETPAAVRFLSCEPLLGPLDLSYWIERYDHCADCGEDSSPQTDDVCPKCGAEGTLVSTWGQAEADRLLSGERYDVDSTIGAADIEGTTPRINWVIAGGESGAKHRPMDLDWARRLRDDCEQAGVAFFLKQLGGHPDQRAHEKAVLDGATHTAFPSVVVHHTSPK